MERIYKDVPVKQRKPGGGLKDMPQCERCGRPVKVSSDDYYKEELLCTHCASEAKASADSDCEAQY